MKTSISVGGYDRGDRQDLTDFVQAADRMGIDYAWSAEAWGMDAFTTLAFLAGRTERIKLGTGIAQISARVPAMTAITALSMHHLSGGRFVLGLGVSGPQVVEGLHGAAYAQPLGRLRETVDIVRMAFRGEKLSYQGKHHVLPREGGEGKAIRLDFPPAEIPIFLATLAPKSLEYTGEAADGWLGTCFSPDHAGVHLDHIRRGAEAAGRGLADIELHASCELAIGEDVEALIEAARPALAFRMGAMGSARTNFYNDAYCRAGYEDDAKAVQALWKQGRRDEAVKRVTDDMITKFAAIGTAEMVRERFRTYRDAGIDGLVLRPQADTPKGQIVLLEQAKDLLRDL